jgi:hypothetical protein
MKTADKDFDPSVIRMFMWEWRAKLYARRARRHGFAATVSYSGSNWIQNGGRW